MRSIHLARLDKVRPVLILTRDRVRGAMTKVTVAPITSTVKGISSEVPLDERNGLAGRSVASCDNVTTIDKRLLGRQVGFLFDDQEADLARALHAAFDLNTS